MAVIRLISGLLLRHITNLTRKLAMCLLYLVLENRRIALLSHQVLLQVCGKLLLDLLFSSGSRGHRERFEW